MRGFCCLAAVSLPLLFAGSATPLPAGEYKDPEGFSFQYPADWWPVTEQTRDDAPELLREWLDRSPNLNLSNVRVVVAHVTEDDVLSNVRVGLFASEVPITEESVQPRLKGMIDRLRSAGVEVRNGQGKIVQLGPNKFLRLQYETKRPGVPGRLHQQQFFLPGGGKTHIVTCTSALSKAVEDAPVFREILESFRVPPPQSPTSEWSRIALMGLIGTIVGGIAAGLVVWLIKLFRKDPDAVISTDLHE